MARLTIGPPNRDGIRIMSGKQESTESAMRLFSLSPGSRLLWRYPATTILLLVGSALTLVAQSQPSYEVYALRYATLPGFPVSELVAGANPNRKIDIAMMIWLVRGNGRNILVDSGFYHERFFKDWEVKDFTKPSETLSRRLAASLKTLQT